MYGVTNPADESRSRFISFSVFGAITVVSVFAGLCLLLTAVVSPIKDSVQVTTWALGTLATGMVAAYFYGRLCGHSSVKVITILVFFLSSITGLLIVMYLLR
jgi:hypothetical protein